MELPKRSADVDVLLQECLVCLEGQNDLGIRVLHCFQDQSALLVSLWRLGWRGAGGIVSCSCGRSMLTGQFVDPGGDGSNGEDLAVGQGRVEFSSGSGSSGDGGSGGGRWAYSKVER